ncbi:hypothetical protein Tco_0530268 [Tanacetum coccineum]
MVICASGKIAKIKTQWTDRNPGRHNCCFIGWVNPPMCNRALDVIPCLLRSRNELEEILKEQCLLLSEKENLVKKLRKNLVIAWLFVFVVYKFL